MAYQKLQPSRAARADLDDNVNIINPADNLPTKEGCVLYVGVGGDVKVLTAGGDEVTFVNVQNGTFLPVQVLRVFSSDTTASDILALW